MKVATALVLFTTAWPCLAALFPRDTATILNDIKTISTQLQTVYDDVKTFQGGPNSANQALQIKGDSDKLDKSLQHAAKDAAASTQLSESDSATVATSVTSLQSPIYSTLDLLVDKKPGFQTAIFGSSADSIVESTLISLRTNSGYFAVNITNKLTPSLKRLGPLIASEIDFHFVRAVQAFST